jgi:hypothetical protein
MAQILITYRRSGCVACLTGCKFSSWIYEGFAVVMIMIKGYFV